MLSKTFQYIACQSQRLITKELFKISLCSITHFRHICTHLRRVTTTTRYHCVYAKQRQFVQPSRIFTFSQRYRTQSDVYVNKLKKDGKQALLEGGIHDECTILAGGFGICGIPMTLISAIKELGTKDLTVVSNDCGTTDWGLGILLHDMPQIKRMIGSYMAENRNVGRMYTAGQLELELMPQGTLAEKLRAGGAGIPAFYTPAGVDTIIESGQHIIRYNEDGYPIITSSPKESRVFNGKKYILEKAITGHIGLVKAWRADEFGNLQFRKTAENFNKPVAMASDFTIAEVEEIVPIGNIPPEQIHVSGIYVQAIIQSKIASKLHYTIFHDDQDGKHHKTGKFTAAQKQSNKDPHKFESISFRQMKRDKIAKRGALELRNGIVVNLGIGLPVMTADYVPNHWRLWMHSENGVLGLGRYPYPGEEDPDCINAGKQSSTLVDGAAMFDSSEAFGMIRGGHLNMKMLGAMQVSRFGDLANWIIPGQGTNVKGMGGGMDLVSNDTYCVVLTHHCTSKGEPKIVENCTYPITGKQCVNRIITEYAVFDVDKMNGLNLIELDEEHIDLQRLKEITACPFTVDEKLRPYRQIDEVEQGNMLRYTSPTT